MVEINNGKNNVVLSTEAKKLYEFFQSEYITGGYLYSGSWPYTSLISGKGYSSDAIHKLVDAGLLQRRDCDDYAFELTAVERKKIIEAHDLAAEWERKGVPFYPNDYNGEVSVVMRECKLLESIAPNEDGKDGVVNTAINYLYRDANNYKVHNECIVSGIITEEQQKIILDCLDEGSYFIPSLVGLPEVKFEEADDPEVDHQWFELQDGDFNETAEKATISITASELVGLFSKCKGRWMEEFFCAPSLDNLIADAAAKSGKECMDKAKDVGNQER